MPDYALLRMLKHRSLIGKRIPRVDSPAKVTGRAIYTYDVQRPGMLYGKVIRCPYARAKVLSIDRSACENNTRGQGRSHRAAAGPDNLLGRR